MVVARRLSPSLSGFDAMSDNLQNRGGKDGSRVNASEDWGVRYWTEKFRCTPEQLKRAVDAVGTSSEAIQNYLSGTAR